MKWEELNKKQRNKAEKLKRRAIQERKRELKEVTRRSFEEALTLLAGAAEFAREVDVTDDMTTETLRNIYLTDFRDQNPYDGCGIPHEDERKRMASICDMVGDEERGKIIAIIARLGKEADGRNTPGVLRNPRHLTSSIKKNAFFGFKATWPTPVIGSNALLCFPKADWKEDLKFRCYSSRVRSTGFLCGASSSSS